MRIDYVGQIKEAKQNTRCAVISYESKEDEKIAERIIDLAYKTTGWKNASGFDGCIYIPVETREEYKDFVEFYKDAKRMFKLCGMYGF